ncbi:hypothetical protein BP5796_07912 [Coleophoma crateriformis]|uniref:Uncharacterized protein n=1 Tax=Coleophoma crateriformis TaxID=565419 RepID=A0A3D8RD78_9HELO|nr:hypothetical protein BP5796_07912 [Coleophoma crateriformis]
MKFNAILLVLASLCLEQASAVTWYFLRWYTPDTSAEFIKVSIRRLWTADPVLGGLEPAGAAAYKNFNQALLAIELYSVAWDFGPLVFKNVVMEVNTTATAWCTSAPENYNSATSYTMSTPVVSTSNGVTTCSIAQVNMTGPA